LSSRAHKNLTEPAYVASLPTGGAEVAFKEILIVRVAGYR